MELQTIFNIAFGGFIMAVILYATECISSMKCNEKSVVKYVFAIVITSIIMIICICLERFKVGY